MVEEKEGSHISGKRKGDAIPSIKLPFCDKGGHLSRSLYWKCQKDISTIFPEIHMRNIPDFQPVPATQSSWLIRRNMFRSPRDGRR